MRITIDFTFLPPSFAGCLLGSLWHWFIGGDLTFGYVVYFFLLSMCASLTGMLFFGDEVIEIKKEKD